MSRLQGRLALLAASGLCFLVGFGALAWLSYQEHLAYMDEVQLSARVLESSQALFRSGRQSEHREFLQQIRKTLQPPFRADTVKRLLSNENRTNLVMLVDAESRFQKYVFELAQTRRYRTILYSCLALAFCVGMTLTFIAVNHRSVFRRLRTLNTRMLDFLNNKYTYEFETPEAHEVGEVEMTFNLMAQRVLQQIEDLKKLDLAKSEFLSIASHELRTPLTSIKGSLSLLKAGVVGTVNEATQNLMTIALTETDRLIRLINDLLDLAKIEAGGFSLDMNWADVHGLLKKTANSLEGFASAAKVSIDVRCETPVEGYLDLDRTQQVITNLASNAIKFSPPDGVVNLVAKIADGNQLRIEITDSGPGIAPQDQELIFEKFRQATSPENPLVKGTGLGLAIAKALVEEQGGTIHVKSEPNQGSTFYFDLPKWRLQGRSAERQAS